MPFVSQGYELSHTVGVWTQSVCNHWALTKISASAVLISSSKLIPTTLWFKSLTIIYILRTILQRTYKTQNCQGSGAVKTSVNGLYRRSPHRMCAESRVQSSSFHSGRRGSILCSCTSCTRASMSQWMQSQHRYLSLPLLKPPAQSTQKHLFKGTNFLFQFTGSFIHSHTWQDLNKAGQAYAWKT